MAYTGILLRGDTFSNIYSDPPIQREAVMAGEFLGLGTVNGDVVYLNIKALSKISEVQANGSTKAGFLVSDIAITYDAGYLVEQADHLQLAGTYKWYYEPLQGIMKADNTDFKIVDTEMKTANLALVSEQPVITALTTSSITIEYANGSKVKVWNETTSTDLGEITTSGSTLTFTAAQNSGDVIRVWAEDTVGNQSLFNKGTIS